MACAFSSGCSLYRVPVPIVASGRKYQNPTELSRLFRLPILPGNRLVYMFSTPSTLLFFLPHISQADEEYVDICRRTVSIRASSFASLLPRLTQFLPGSLPPPYSTLLPVRLRLQWAYLTTNILVPIQTSQSKSFR